MNLKKISNLIFFWCGLRLFVGLIQAFYPINSPHIWRQVDTLGVSLRYWLRWTVEGASSHPLLPAILNSGDTNGIMATEFPLLNLLGAPSFMFGLDAGRIVASLVIVALIALFSYLNFRVWKRVDAPFSPLAFLLFPIFSFAAGFTFKFMPDLLASLLMFLGLGFIWRPHMKSSLFLGILCMCLGGLMKPISFVCCGILFLHRDAMKWNIKIWVASITSLVVALSYYLIAIRWLRSLEETESHFMVEFRPPLSAITSFFSDPVLSQLDFFSYHTLAPFMIVLMVLLWFTQKPPFKMLGVILLQTMAVVVLDGRHAYIHAYYFIPTALLWAAVFIDAFENTKFATARVVLAVWMTLRLVEISAMDLSGISQANTMASKFSECKMLRARHPELPWGRGFVFRSTAELFPSLGLCFGERQDSLKSEYGFFYSDQEIPTECIEIDRSQSFVLSKCSSKG